MADPLSDGLRKLAEALPATSAPGTGLFSSLAAPVPLELIEADDDPSGGAIHLYRPRRKAA